MYLGEVWVHFYVEIKAAQERAFLWTPKQTRCLKYLKTEVWHSCWYLCTLKTGVGSWCWGRVRYWWTVDAWRVGEWYRGVSYDSHCLRIKSLLRFPSSGPIILRCGPYIPNIARVESLILQGELECFDPRLVCMLRCHKCYMSSFYGTFFPGKRKKSFLTIQFAFEHLLVMWPQAMLFTC